jgi:hypothetical protein
VSALAPDDDRDVEQEEVFVPPRIYRVPEESEPPMMPVVDFGVSNQRDVVALMNDALEQLNKPTMWVAPDGLEESREPALFRKGASTRLLKLVGENSIPMDVDEHYLGDLLFEFIQPVKTTFVNMNGVQTPVQRDLNEIPMRPLKALMQVASLNAIPQLDQVMDAPLIKEDGTIRWRGGYDTTTGNWIRMRAAESRAAARWEQFLSDVESGGAAESHRQATEAAKRFYDYFSLFEFAHPSHAADAMAAALTPWIIRLLGGDPMPMISILATDPQSGKSTLAKSILMVGGLSSDDWMAVPYAKENDKEFLNGIDSAALSGRRALLMDNVKARIGGQMFESLLTDRKHSVRLFHTQTRASMRWDAMVVATLNSPMISSDMRRRTFPIEMARSDVIDYDAIREAEYSLRRDHETFDLHLNVCKIISHWISVGMPDGAGPGVASLVSGSYGRWAKIVGGILETSGITGFGEAREAVLSHSIASDVDSDAVYLDCLWTIMQHKNAWRQVMGMEFGDLEYGMQSQPFEGWHLMSVLNVLRADPYYLANEDHMLVLAVDTLVHAMGSSKSERSAVQFLRWREGKEWLSCREAQMRLISTPDSRSGKMRYVLQTRTC